MRTFSRYLAGCFLILMVLGCSSSPEETVIPTQLSQPTRLLLPTASPTSQGQLPKLTGTWQIKLAQSGGIMGMARNLEVSSDGIIIVTDQRTNKTNQGRLTADKLAGLIELVSSSSYQPVSSPAKCADCFNFEIDITNETGTFQVQLNQIDLQNSGLQPLVAYLGEIQKTVGK